MGIELVNQVTSGTGLPQELIDKEFSDILKKYGKSPESLTLEDLREVMAEYLQDVFVEAKNYYR